MNRFRNYVLMAAGFAVLAMTVGAFTAGHAIAQAVRAALVSNVDDPGRIPYQVTQACRFTGSVCFATLPAVTAGKRLVITHVSGSFIEDVPAGSEILVTVGILTDTVVLPTTYAGNSGNNYNRYVFAQPELIFCDGGRSLNVEINMGATLPSNSSGGGFTLSGYMLDCTTGPCAAILP